MSLHYWSESSDEATSESLQPNRSAQVVIQQKDGSITQQMAQREDSFYTEIPDGEPEGLSTVINRLITFALDTLQAQHVELRVVTPSCDE
jgi:hypothetical protein